MNRCKSSPIIAVAFLALAAFALLGALPTLAQTAGLNPRATKIGTTSLTIAWDEDPGTSTYYLRYNDARTSSYIYAQTGGLSFTMTDLRPDTAYEIVVESNYDYATFVARTKSESDQEYDGDGKSDDETVKWRPPDVTCPNLPPRVLVFGYAVNSQCQMVGEVVIGKYADLTRRGFIDAVDVWSYVNGGLEVCFRNAGYLVFLDAAYLQRMAMELPHYYRDGMTCGTIDRIGTVVLLASPPSLPALDVIPLSDCQIKLVDTLFLRAEPAGEIIGLVWLNSEVQAFEMNGFWYRVEFEGRTGYISRFYRKVLRGGCG